MNTMNTMNTGASVMGIVESTRQAESVLASLQGAGVASDEISVLFPDTEGTQEFAHEHSTKAPQGALTGAGAGGAAGGTVGLLAGVGALAIPGLGPLIAAGPLMAALSGAAAGATLGGLSGALIGMGIPETEAKQYEGQIKGGSILIAVHTESRDEKSSVETIMKQAGAHDITAA